MASFLETFYPFAGIGKGNFRSLFTEFLLRTVEELTAVILFLVERMLKLHADLPAAKSPDALTRLQREIKATDAAIDRLVYELYELTPEEIALVEAATAPQAKTSAEDGGEAEASPPPAPGATVQAEMDAAHHHGLNEEQTPYKT